MADKENQIEATQADTRPTGSTDESKVTAEQSTLFDSGEAPHSTTAPSEFGRYRLLKGIGEGGMGSVYLAHDTQLDRQVALKIPRFRADQEGPALKRFLREARAAALLRHPNICPIYDVGDINGTHFLTMAFIEGAALTEKTQPDSLLPPRKVATLMAKILRAMHEAHSHGIVHRDLKPANIMLDVRGEPVIMDFGLARHHKPGGEALTQDGAVMGTPAYMAPEQVDGDAERIGPATDLYSLGVMLFELLCGQRPFKGSVASLMAQVLRDDPPAVSTLRHGIHPILELACEKAMAKQPEQRHASAEDFARALERFLETSEGNSTEKLTITGEPQVIEAPAEPIETYDLSGITEGESVSIHDFDPEAEHRRIEKLTGRIQQLLGESRLAQSLIEFGSLPDPEDRGERLTAVLKRCRARISKLEEDGQHMQAVLTAAALHVAGSVSETLKELITTVERVASSAWTPDEPKESLGLWARAIGCFPKEPRLKRNAAAFANRQGVSLSKNGLLAEAFVLYRQGTKWDDNPTLRKNLLSVCRKLATAALAAKRPDRAEKLCVTGLTIAPEDPQLQELLSRAQKLKK